MFEMSVNGCSGIYTIHKSWTLHTKPAIWYTANNKTLHGKRVCQ